MHLVPTASARGSLKIPRFVAVTLGIVLATASLQGVIRGVAGLAQAERAVLREGVAPTSWREGHLPLGVIDVARGDVVRVDACPAPTGAPLRLTLRPTAGGTALVQTFSAEASTARACTGVRWTVPRAGSFEVVVDTSAAPPSLRRLSMHAGPTLGLRTAWPLLALALALALLVLAPLFTAPPAHRDDVPVRPPVDRAWGTAALGVSFVLSLTLPFVVFRVLGRSPLTPLLALLSQHVSFAACAAWMLGGASRDALGFARVEARWIGRALPCAAALIGIALGTSLWITDTSDSPLAQELASTPARLTILYTALVAPLSEELFYRGAVQRSFQRAGALAAVVLQAVVFTALHAAQLRGARWGLLPIAAVGLCNGWLRRASGGLAAPWLVHTLYNAALIATAFAAPG